MSVTLLGRFYPESTFGGFSDIDGTVAFYARVNALISPKARVIDFGCGRGGHSEDVITFRRNLTCLQGKVSTVIGLDVDPVASGNPRMDDFRLLRSGAPWPVESESIDLIVSDCVTEHLPDPVQFFAEACRVLVAGGFLCIRTPNRWSYVAIASRLIPNKRHTAVLKHAQPNRRDEDVFPTLYRCNTVRAIRKQMQRHGFQSVVYGYEAEPSYLNFSNLAYGLGVLHQRLAPACMRPSIFAFGKKSD